MTNQPQAHEARPLPGLGTLKTRYTVIVPIFTEDGDHNMDFIDDFARKVSDIAGGATSYLANGHWSPNPGALLSETVRVIIIDVQHPSSAAQIEALLPLLRRDTQQQELYVTVQQVKVLDVA